jgi:putative SOS response-associated peptidase YedK
VGPGPPLATNPKHKGFVNACAETAATLPCFRDSFRHGRCLVPAGGFYEWERRGDRKQPDYFTGAGGRPLVFDGLWDRCGAVEG